MVVLETQRMTLRHLVPEDLSALFELYRDPEVRRYFPDGTRTLDETRQELDGSAMGTPIIPGSVFGPPWNGAPVPFSEGAACFPGRSTVNTRSSWRSSSTSRAGVKASPLRRLQPSRATLGLPSGSSGSFASSCRVTRRQSESREGRHGVRTRAHRRVRLVPRLLVLTIPDTVTPIPSIERTSQSLFRSLCPPIVLLPPQAMALAARRSVES